MRMKEDNIELFINGRLKQKTTTTKDCPVAVLYVENEDFAKQQAKGLSAAENHLEVLKRAATAFFEMGFNTLEEIEQIDPQAAEEMRVDLGLQEYIYADEEEIYLGNGVSGTANLAGLEPPAAAADPGHRLQQNRPGCVSEPDT